MKHSSLDFGEGCVGLKGISPEVEGPLFTSTLLPALPLPLPLCLWSHRQLLLSAGMGQGCSAELWSFFYFLAFLFLSEGEYF